MTFVKKKIGDKVLMKWRSVDNFTNILQAAFLPIFFPQKSQRFTVSREKLLVKC